MSAQFCAVGWAAAGRIGVRMAWLCRDGHKWHAQGWSPAHARPCRCTRLPSQEWDPFAYFRPERGEQSGRDPSLLSQRRPMRFAPAEPMSFGRCCSRMSSPHPTKWKHHQAMSVIYHFVPCQQSRERPSRRGEAVKSCYHLPGRLRPEIEKVVNSNPSGGS